MASKLLTIDLDQIAVGERIGFYWPDKAQALGRIILKEGQHTPIIVRKNGPRAAKPWALVAGLHRMRGMDMAGLVEIQATEVLAGVEPRLVEASENMHRRDFGPLEKALFVRALADSYEARFYESNDGLTPQQVGQKKRWEAEREKVQMTAAKLADLDAEHSADTMSGLFGWQNEAAEAIGLSTRRMRDYLLIYRTIVEPFSELYEPLARHPLGQKRSSVMEIANITGEEGRGKVIEWILQHEAIETVAQAKVWAGLSASKHQSSAQGQTKLMNNAGSNLERFTPSSWREFAPALADQVKPSALLAVRDALNDRIKALGGENALGKAASDDE